ncbi:SAM-dependent methyltransferase [Pseudonocardia sp. MH-G8]|uniref:SAM-dependent methyltransferase n=1 Tax=Pseudonocardia sp. MH-G8 TaxID=1854588 RepID=UPI000BA0BAA3|nr:SAM-dependent methyltransferase [Pseudonocardia sp. MH-G8]OZM83951.1 SAM-dependent methyltransferase [Pseudonocardia sp. MH-G8]
MDDRATARATGDGSDGHAPPPDVDLGTPSIARLYDYVLGGKENFEVDRRAADALYEAVPETSQLAKDNRNHLRRAVQWLVREAGIRQIIDLGSGLPTVGNVHELAQAVDPDVHVVYVDNDPLVLAHGRALLSDETTTTVITADAREPESIFANPRTAELIDLQQPYAVIAASILHHLDDDVAYDVAARIRAQLDSGCYVLISNFLDDDEPRAKELERAFLEGGLGTGRFRSWSEQRRFYDDLEMVEPGLVYANDWRPDHLTPAESRVHTLYAAGVARKP